MKQTEFTYLVSSNTLTLLAFQMQAVAIGWLVYARTGDPLSLGLVGLFEMLPVLFLFLPAGHLADHLDPRRILRFGALGYALCALGFLLAARYELAVGWFYAGLVVSSALQTLMRPTRDVMLSAVVTRGQMARAVTWNSSVMQLTMVLGPALGGLLIAVSGTEMTVFAVNLAFGLAVFALVSLIAPKPSGNAVAATGRSFSGLLAGVHFLRRTPVLLGTITLDLFAVLLGGATALLPIYAKDILEVGASGFGWLRAAPAIGAVLMALYLVRFGDLRRSGRKMLWAVAWFGLATVVFGLSRWFWLSMMALILAGALDQISVVVRQSLVQLRSPREVRGRVASVNRLFISASNELGAFRAGLMASWLGAIPAVVIGGGLTVAVVYAVGRLWPQIGVLDRLEEDEEPAAA